MQLSNEKHKQTYLFSWDSLTIYDGGSSTSPMMGKYCGASIPPSHISSSKEIMVHFETDSYNGNENGFKMEYNPTSKQSTTIQNNTEILVVFKEIFEHRTKVIGIVDSIVVTQFLPTISHQAMRS